MAASKRDIFISIKEEHMNSIVTRKKNHEFRKYLIAQSVQRMWFYVSKPDQTLRYIAVIGQGRTIGEIEQDDGLGNAEFNAGLTDSKYAYEILHLYRLKRPRHITELKEEWGFSPPQRYTFLKTEFVDLFPLNDQTLLF